jgi:PPOX class probable F420-dependent enzyme
MTATLYDSLTAGRAVRRVVLRHLPAYNGRVPGSVTSVDRHKRWTKEVVVKIPQEVRALIEAGRPAHLVTLNPDGSPQVTIVWIGLDGDDVVAGHLPRHRKVRNIERDPRVAISIDADSRSAMGLTEYVVLYGRARIEIGGAPELLQRLAHVYLGQDVKFPPMENPPPGYVTRVQVDRLDGVGPWTGRAV